MSGNLKIKYPQLSSSIPQRVPATTTVPVSVTLASHDYPLVQALNSVTKLSSSDPATHPHYISVVPEESASAPGSSSSSASAYASQYNNLLSDLQLYPKSLYPSHGNLLLQQKVAGAYLQHNYPEIIRGQEARGNILLAFDQDWIIPAIASFIMYHSDIKPYDIPTENAVKYNIRQVTQVDISRKLTPDMIEIVPVNDTSLIQGTTTLSRYYLLFAPVTYVDAERIYLYLYRDFKLYSFYNYLAVPDCDPYVALDFQKLYPVLAATFKNFTIFRSSILSRDDLISIYYSNTITLAFPRLEPLFGCYATYLLAEATQYRFTVSWQDRSLHLQDCAYIQSVDIRALFCNIMKDICISDVVLKRIDRTTIDKLVVAGIKCFYYCGEYYGAFPKFALGGDDAAADGGTPSVIDNVSEVELADPLRSVAFPHLRAAGLALLSRLGYNTVVPLPAKITELTVAYITVQQRDQIVTIYYYQTSYGVQRIVAKIHGGLNAEIQSVLTTLLQLGWFFSARGRNIVTSYPGFIPNDPPVNTSLPHHAEALLTRLHSVLLSLTTK